jgi:hypothetical protein
VHVLFIVVVCSADDDSILQSMNVASQEFVSQETLSKEYEANYDDEKS